MQRLRLTTIPIALSVFVAAGVASADDPKPPEQPAEQPAEQPPEQPSEQPAEPAAEPRAEPRAEPAKQKQKQKQLKPRSADTAQPRRTSAEIMKITEQAMVHIEAAQAALEKGDKAAASRALARSEASLGKLYNTPELAAVLNELDEAIASIEGDRKGERRKQALEELDLAPLSATVRRHQLYLDPAVAAGIDEAAARAKQGDAKATADALRLARDRVAIDVAFIPVEDAYVRVLAAQHAIEHGDLKQAQKFLHNVPVVVAELQISSPLVSIRFMLNAAALAAEQGNWERSQSLVREATTEMQNLERLSRGTPSAPEVSALVDDVENLNRQMGSDARPRPEQIRDVAKRTRDLGA